MPRPKPRAATATTALTVALTAEMAEVCAVVIASSIVIPLTFGLGFTQPPDNTPSSVASDEQHKPEGKHFYS